MTKKVLILILAIAGMINSFYLSLLHLSMAPGCQVGCNQVLASGFSTVSGIPLSVLGFGVYTLMASLAIYLLNDKKSAWAPLTLTALAAFLAHAALFVLQFAVIKAFCPFCLASFGIATLIFATAIWHHRQNKGEDLNNINDNVSEYLTLVALSVILPVVIFMVFKTPRISHTVAEINGQTYSLSDIDQALGIERLQLEEKLNKKRENWIDQKLYQLEADRLNLSMDAYIEQQLSMIDIPEDVIKEFYDENRNYFKSPYHVEKRRILKHFRKQEGEQVMENLAKSLRLTYNVKVDLPEPLKLAPEINPYGSPVYGAKIAKQTLVVFSDFQCPFCRKVHEEINDRLAKDPNAFQVEYRYYPLPNHKFAKKAAVTAYCADQQGQFEKVADALYINQMELSDKKLIEIAETAGLDMAAYNECRLSDDPILAIDADIKEGRRLEVSYTPTMIFEGYLIQQVPQN